MEKAAEHGSKISSCERYGSPNKDASFNGHESAFMCSINVQKLVDDINAYKI
jgi:hypothetical protein